MDLGTIALLLIMLGAYVTGTVLGFGSSILAVTFGAHLMAMDVLLPTLAPLNLALGAYLAIRHWRHVDWRLLWRRVWPAVAIGLPLGLALFNLRQIGWLRALFGLLVTVLAAGQLRQLYRPSRPAPPDDDPHRGRPLGGAKRLALLFGGGVIHGLYGVGGPLIVYVLGREIDDKGVFRATLSVMFLPLTTALVVDYAMVGLMSRRVAELTLLCAVPMLLGLLLGEWAHGRVDNRRFKLAVWLMLLGGGLVLTGRALLG